jgi:hypothetical protein
MLSLNTEHGEVVVRDEIDEASLRLARAGP